MARFKAGAVDVFFWAGETGTSLTKDIWKEFTPEIADTFIKTYERAYKAILTETTE